MMKKPIPTKAPAEQVAKERLINAFGCAEMAT